MRAVVTGATGFVGRWLVDELLNQGNEVIVVIRNMQAISQHWKGKVDVIETSLEKINNIEIGNRTADVFFHLAWAGTSGIERMNVQLQLLNVQYTCDAVDLALKLGCKRFINAGSIMEYEAMKGISDDNYKSSTGYIYGVAKLAANYMAKIIANQKELEYISLIISNIYGIGENSPRFLNSTLRKMIKNEDIPLTEGIQLYDFIYVEDAVKGIVLVAKKGKANSSYYIGNSKPRSLKSFVEEMYMVIDSNAKLMFGVVAFNGVQLDYTEFNTGSLNTLGFIPKVTFAEGIRLTKEWILEREGGIE